MSGLIAGKDLGRTSAEQHSLWHNARRWCHHLRSYSGRLRLLAPGSGSTALSVGGRVSAHLRKLRAWEFELLPNRIHEALPKGLMLDMSYTYLDQKTSALDTANSSLGGIGYNPFNPEADYGTDGYVSKHRFIAYGIYDLPIGRNHRVGNSFSKWADTLLGRLANDLQYVCQVRTRLHPVLDLRRLRSGRAGEHRSVLDRCRRRFQRRALIPAGRVGQQHQYRKKRQQRDHLERRFIRSSFGRSGSA